MNYNPAILYDPKAAINLTDFGIEIPALDTRATKTLEGLKSHNLLTQANCYSRITERLEQEDLTRVHSTAFVENLFAETAAREIILTYELLDSQGKPHRYSPEKSKRDLSELVHLLILQAAGTLQAARTALERGFCFFLGGGMHHAQYDHGSGFCLVNDMVIAAVKLLEEKRVSRVWIIDIDAHKGDGTAALCSGREDILTLSIHMAQGWPLDKESLLAYGPGNPSLIPSTVELPIPSGGEPDYLSTLGRGLERLKEVSPSLPDLALVVDGSDPYEKDALPSAALLNLSENTMLERDLLVYNFLKALGIPSAWVMAGGYGEESWRIYFQFLNRILSSLEK